MSSFAARSTALEGSYFRAEEKLALQRHLEHLVDEGTISRDLLNSLTDRASHNPASEVPVEVRGRPEAEYVYRHIKGAIPAANLPSIRNWSLGTPISMGRNRFTVNDVSIFDVAEGKKLAATPRSTPSMFEIRRAQSIQKAAMDTPLVNGYRLYPELNPGRAFFWGTILAVTGTLIGSKIACVVLEIKEVGDISTQVHRTLEPLASALSSTVEPFRTSMALAGSETSEKSSTAIGEFAEKIKINLKTK